MARRSRQRSSLLSDLLIRLGGLAGVVLGLLWALPTWERLSVPRCRQPEDCLTTVFEVMFVPFVGRLLLGAVLGLLVGGLVARTVRELRSR